MDVENNFFKRREKELVEDATVLEKAIKNFWEILPIPVCTTSPIFIVLETGKGFDTLFGYAKNELVGGSLKETAFDKDSFKEMLDNLSQQRKISNIETVLKNKKGEKISVFVSAIAQEDEQGEVFSYLFSFVDVTLIKKAEIELQERIADSVKKAQELTKSKQALLNILEDVEAERKIAEEEKERTATIIRNFTDGLLLLENNRVVLVNPRAEEFFGFGQKQLIGRKINELSQAAGFEIFSQIFHNWEKVFEKKELIFENGRTLGIRRIIVKGEGYKNEEIVIFHDITREKFIEKMKAEFVTIAAHQLRTPISAVKWIMRMMLDGDLGSLPDNQRNYLQKAYESNERMVRLVNDLLNITRIEEGRFLYDVKKEDLVAIIQKVIDGSLATASEKNLGLFLIKPEGKIPKIFIDAGKISLAIQNLLDNALNYTKEGKVEVDISFSPEKKEFLIKVKDTGIGIPKDQQERVFSRFFRAGNAVKTETSGTGLGLFIAKNIIEAHYGKIWFESEEGKGTLFSLSLPMKNREDFERFVREV